MGLDLQSVAAGADASATAPSGQNTGYWLVAADGGVFSFGDAPFFGSLGGQRLNKPIVGLAPTPDGRGYWLVAADGGVFTFGNARFFGSTGSMRLNKPIVGMAPTVDGAGYDLVAADGGVFTFGDAVFHGSAASGTSVGPFCPPAAAILVRTWHDAPQETRAWEFPSGDGYRILGAPCGGVYPFEVPNLGGSYSPGDPAVGIAATANGGYWEAYRSGSVSTSGDVPNTTYGPQVDSYGQLPANRHAPIVGIAGTPDSRGYLLFASDGGVFTFGDAAFYGSASALHLRAPIVGGAAIPLPPSA